jgi:hypothetical protein
MTNTEKIEQAIKHIDENILEITAAISDPSTHGKLHDIGFDKAADHARLVLQEIKNILIS